ncbi:MAG: hypothetical protein AABY09_03215 [Nanoarchaeota archaeon]
MVSITVALEESTKAKMDGFLWINWSEVGAEQLMRRDIFEKFIKGIGLSEEDETFCERTGWDPLDEMELREEYIEKLKKLEKGPFRTAKRLEFWKE